MFRMSTSHSSLLLLCLISFLLVDRALTFRGAVPLARPIPVGCSRTALPKTAFGAPGPAIASAPRCEELPTGRAISRSLSSVAFDADDAEFEASDRSLREDTPLRRMRREEVAILSRRKRRNVGILFGLWYTLSIGYNIFSKKALNLAPNLAWTAAFFQMTLGMLYVGPLWLSGIRSRPELTLSEIMRLLPVAVLHCLVHVGGVVSMGAGAVSFTYIVKASEPAVSAALSALATKTFLPLPVYLTLIPVMGGVALSSVSELTFSWKSFNYAMLSNVASASRGIVGKNTMQKKLGKNMNAMNTYAVLTLLSSAMLLPVALLLEGPVFMSTLGDLQKAGKLNEYIAQTLMAALSYYTYNECAFMCLDNVSPVSHALGNTLKRVFIIITSILVFGNKMTAQGIVGSVMAIAGVFLYSLAKTKYVTKK